MKPPQKIPEPVSEPKSKPTAANTRRKRSCTQQAKSLDKEERSQANVLVGKSDEISTESNNTISVSIFILIFIRFKLFYDKSAFL